MSGPTEHKTLQARILEYAEAIGWTLVSQKEAEQRRGFDPETPIKDRAKGRTLFFEDWLDAKVREFNPRYAEAEKRERDLPPDHKQTKMASNPFTNHDLIQ